MKHTLSLLLSLSLMLAPEALAQHCHSAPAEESTASETAQDFEVPDASLLNQDGHEVSFRDLVGGKVVAMNFVFTTCTTVCPPMGANFGKLQRLLGDRAGQDVDLISISIDPTVDTPRRLKAWSQKFGTEQGWTLLTGEKPTVDRLLKDLGVFVADKQYHSPITLLGNESTGVWQRTNGLTPADELLRQLDELRRSGEAGSMEVAP